MCTVCIVIQSHTRLTIARNVYHPKQDDVSATYPPYSRHPKTIKSQPAENGKGSILPLELANQTSMPVMHKNHVLTRSICSKAASVRNNKLTKFKNISFLGDP